MTSQEASLVPHNLPGENNCPTAEDRVLWDISQPIEYGTLGTLTDCLLTCNTVGMKVNLHQNSWEITPDSKIHGANVGLTLGCQDPGGPHFGHMNLAIWVLFTLIQFWTNRKCQGYVNGKQDYMSTCQKWEHYLRCENKANIKRVIIIS